MPWVAEDGSKLSDQEMERLTMLKVAEPTVGQKVGATVMGAAEAYNPLSLPRALEFGGRVLKRITFPEAGDVQQLEPGKLVGAPAKSLGQIAAEEEKKLIAPDLSVRKGVETVAGKDFAAGLPQSYETAGGLAAALLGGIKGARGLIKGSPIRQAKTATEGVVRDVKYLTGVPEGPVMTKILEAPEEVGGLLKAGKLGVADLSSSIAGELQTIKDTLGKAVGDFKTVAMADKTPSIKAATIVQKLNSIESSATSATGKSALTPADLGLISKVRALLPALNAPGKKGMISPSDALLITDTIDPYLYGQVAGSNIHKRVISALREVRSNLKEAARQSGGAVAGWEAADEKYSQFKELADDLINKFSGDSGPGNLDRILAKNKDPLRGRLVQALDLVNPGTGEKYMGSVAARKAAQNLKAMDVTTAVPLLDQQNRIFKKWVDRGTLAGASAGAWVGEHIGGGTAAAVGAAGGGLAGRIAVQPLARWMASPARILEKAQKAKILSQEAKQLASDLNWLQKAIGPEAANALSNLVTGSLPAANELGLWLRGQAAGATP